MSHYSAIGFPAKEMDEVLRLAEAAFEHGEKIEAGDGAYFRLADVSGAELWLRSTGEREIVLLSPHYRGSTRMQVGLEAAVVDAEDHTDGFRAWAGVEDPEQPLVGDYPLVFNCPDFHAQIGLELPKTEMAQLACFADQLQAFADEDAFREGTKQPTGLSFSVESFIPLGLFEEEGPRDPYTLPLAIVNGTLLDQAMKVNSMTDEAFWWGRVRTLGGELDLVATPGTIKGRPQSGGIISAIGWVSGTLL